MNSYEQQAILTHRLQAKIDAHRLLLEQAKTAFVWSYVEFERQRTSQHTQPRRLPAQGHTRYYWSGPAGSHPGYRKRGFLRLEDVVQNMREE